MSKKEQDLLPFLPGKWYTLFKGMLRPQNDLRACSAHAPKRREQYVLLARQKSMIYIL